MTQNQKAFLDTISVSEGTSTSPTTKNNGYDVIVTGVDGKSEIFTDYSDHPFAHGRLPKQINSKGLYSTASGRYQIMLHDWPYYKKLLNLPDFGPTSQDKYALQLIRERHALPMLDAGRFADAVAACSNLWASLPGAGYAGQHMNKLADLQTYFLKSGGQLA